MCGCQAVVCCKGGSRQYGALSRVVDGLLLYHMPGFACCVICQPIAQVVSQRWQELSDRGTGGRHLAYPEVDLSNPFSSPGTNSLATGQGSSYRPAGGRSSPAVAGGGAGHTDDYSSRNRAGVSSGGFRGEEHFASMLEAAEQVFHCEVALAAHVLLMGLK
jgi:hypothetical protein